MLGSFPPELVVVSQQPVYSGRRSRRCHVISLPTGCSGGLQTPAGDAAVENGPFPLSPGHLRVPHPSAASSRMGGKPQISNYFPTQDTIGRGVQAGDAEGVGLPGAVRVAHRLHEGEQLRRRREVAHGNGEIVVGSGLAADDAPDGREHAAEVDCIGPAHEAAGLAELQNPQLAAGFQHAMEFAEAGLVVGQIAEAEGRDNQIQRCGAQRQVQSVGFEWGYAGIGKFLCSAA